MTGVIDNNNTIVEKAGYVIKQYECYTFQRTKYETSTLSSLLSLYFKKRNELVISKHSNFISHKERES